MNIEAMNQLIRVLKAVPPEHFNMSDVANLGAPIAGGSITTQDLHTCGSAACVIGYAGADPWFQQKGLSLRYNGNRWAGIDEQDAADVLGLTGKQLDLIFIAEHPLVHDKSMSTLTPQDMIAVVEAMIADHLAGRPLGEVDEEEDE